MYMCNCGCSNEAPGGWVYIVHAYQTPEGMIMQLAEAVTYCMARENVFVPASHPTVTKAVREAERAIAHGVQFKIAVAFGVAQANDRAAHALNQIGA